MFPRRRFRLFTLCATVVLFLLYRVAQNLGDDSSRYTPAAHLQHNTNPLADELRKTDKLSTSLSQSHDHEAAQAHEPPQALKETDPITVPQVEHHSEHVISTEDVRSSGDKPEAHPAESDKSPNQGETRRIEKDDSEDLVNMHWENPPKTSSIKSDNVDEKPSKIHWKPVAEHFPVPSDSIRPIPSPRRPSKIPQIQFTPTKPESDELRSKRELRRDRVKQEIKRAWSGYKKYAWMHDELSPVSAKFRDPFCQWAATLVDSLDTLWLAGLREDFDEAAHAVKDIDFTWSPRDSIPVFETTIRYLGGLLSALDVSGGLEGEYSFLLDKAVELAEILMGVFDTPNRMPVLYYQWKPEYASQPHRAGVVGMAELGTLSMEFTRLAQLTENPKYYDAIDRITDALVEMQTAGTVLPGLFPENLDASGCNKTATPPTNTLSLVAQAQVDSDELSESPDGYVADQLPKEKLPSKSIQRRGPVPPPPRPGQDAMANRVPQQQRRTRKGPTKPGPLAADGTTTEWDCVPQGLVPDRFKWQSFHIGGGQDSAYEYFQKEWLLLGASEEKYAKLHLDSIDAIDKWLLYRPMIQDDWDILFPAKITVSGASYVEGKAVHEVTHLSCFIGGMYAMSSKLFGREKDLETAARLTDGCVWAYGATPSGIMPEAANMMACPTLEKCEFNETKWWEELDPSWDWRKKKVAQWEEEWGNYAESQSGKGQGVLDAGTKLPKSLKDKLGQSQETAKNREKREMPSPAELASERDAEELPLPKQKPFSLNSVLEANRLPPAPDAADAADVAATEAPIKVHVPQRPLSHEEFVKNLLEIQKLPPGFTTIGSAYYILRPEAIESVFYMYRITGDPTWQDKGWKMFEATILATRTKIANSAIQNVFNEEPVLKNEMESFWLAETLKYYYLLFCDLDVANLDEWVFNTEAHPFRRPL